MSGIRRAWLDACPGERRGVVTLDGRPEHLFIERAGEPPYPRLGERWRVRIGVRSPDRRQAFVDLGGGLDGLIRLPADARLPQGSLVEAEVAAEPQGGKSARFKLTSGSAEGRPGLAWPGESLEDQLARLVQGPVIERGPEAREIADAAEEVAFAPAHAFADRVIITIETTRAMSVVDVDASAAGERGTKTEAANRLALAQAARLLRLKALGGTVAVDLIGFPRNLDRIMADARAAFLEDGPETVLLPPNRLGVLMLSRPRGRRPLHETLLDPDGRPSARTIAQRLVRELEREGRADPGARLRAVCAPEVAAELRPLTDLLGPRFGVVEAPGSGRQETHIRQA